MTQRFTIGYKEHVGLMPSEMRRLHLFEEGNAKLKRTFEDGSNAAVGISPVVRERKTGRDLADRPLKVDMKAYALHRLPVS